MATFSIQNITLSGISCCVPKKTEHNFDISSISAEDIKKFVDATGVENRRIADSSTCTSDLCVRAAEDLIKGLDWNKDEIEILIFVTQTADYITPVSSAIIQDRLGLSKKCLTFDVPLGCSGYVYGLSIVAGMMQSAKLKKGLLLVGDTISKTVSETDKSTMPLFGDAGAATALCYDENAKPMLFDLGSDGSGYEAIIIPDGGARNRLTNESLKRVKYDEGIERNNYQLTLEGMNVFSFGISQAPKTFNSLVSHFNLDVEKVDYFVFHQANMMMNKMIAKKLKLPESKVPYSLKDFGNTSSATIPLTIASQLKDNLGGHRNWIMCGFGVGLSWGTAYIETDNLVCLDIIEY